MNIETTLREYLTQFEQGHPNFLIKYLHEVGLRPEDPTPTHDRYLALGRALLRLGPAYLCVAAEQPDALANAMYDDGLEDFLQACQVLLRTPFQEDTEALQSWRTLCGVWETICIDSLREIRNLNKTPPAG